MLHAERLFHKRFNKAILMKGKHREIFAKFNATFKSETVEKWERMVREWEQDNEKPNPYAEHVNGK
jgi:hypothetical protein